MIKDTYFTVGPSQLYPTVKDHIYTALEEDIPSISHRGDRFAHIYESTIASLKKLMNIPESFKIYFMGSATEGMERIIQNTIGVSSTHFVNGAFSSKFYQTAVDYGKKPEKIEVPFGSGFDKSLLKVKKGTECICITQCETSTGTAFPIEDVYSLKEQNPAALTAIDIVSSAPYVHLDFKYIDLAFFSVQKGFGLPAGLGVLLVSPAAFAKAESLSQKGMLLGSYHSFLSFEKYNLKRQTPETPNSLDIYLLGKICEDMLARGISLIRKETDEKAALIYNFFDHHKIYKPFVSDKKFRAATTITIDTPGRSAQIVSSLQKKGFIIGRGYGAFKDDKIRIANFPSHSVSDVQSLLRSFPK